MNKILLFCVTIFSLSPYYIDCYDLTHEELCTGIENKEFTKFRVNSGFKIGQYMAFIGQVWKKSKSEPINATIRVFYFDDKRDPSRDKPHPFFKAKVWHEIQNIENENKIRYAFTTDKMDALAIFTRVQKMSEVVFIVQVCPSVPTDTPLLYLYCFRRRTQRLPINLITRRSRPHKNPLLVNRT